MAIICAYQRPATIEGALACLAHENAVLVGGGTKPKAAASPGPVEVVDLQDLRLDQWWLQSSPIRQPGLGIMMIPPQIILSRRLQSSSGGTPESRHAQDLR